jgi:peptidyl-prolyl cis-trans isomerase SurA
VRRLLLPLVLAVATWPASASARPPARRAGIVERIVAVVDADIVLLSELEARARPFRAQIAKSIPDAGPRRIAAEQQLLTDLLDKVVDEHLEAAEAKRLHVETTPQEVDAALGTLASSQKLTVPQLLAAANADAGLSEPEYRAEIERQLLEGKLLFRRVHERVPSFATLSEQERAKRFEEERGKWLGELRAAAFVEKRL